MKLILRFLKPHWKLCVFTTLFMALDMVGMMLIPTYAAEMLNKGSSAVTGFGELMNTGIKC